MAKIIKIALFLVATVVALWANSPYMQQLEQYDSQLKGASKGEQLKIFHGLQSIYIKATVSGDNELKEETLTRLIKTSKGLNQDTSKYEAELKKLQKEHPSSGKKNATKEVLPEKSLKQEEPKVLKDESSQENNSVSASSYKGKNILKTVTTDKEVIIFTFSNPVDAKKIKVVGLNNGSAGYKKIIDVPAIIFGKTPTARPVGVCEKVHINQYNPEMIRIVLDAKKPFDLYASTVGEKLFLSFSKDIDISSLQTPVTKETKNQPSMISTNTPTTTPTPKVIKVDSKTTSSQSNKTKQSKIIVIDAGHGGKDAGAIGYKNRKEKNLVLDIALDLGKELQQRGHKVFYTRKKDEFINLRDRTKVANDKNADLFISLHANAASSDAKKSSMKGLETFFLSPDRSERSKNVAALENQSDMEEMAFYSKETFLNVLNREKIVLSNKVAIDIQSGMLKSARKKYSITDGGVREAPFWVLVGATMPSVLVEVGYITNPEECERMFDNQYQKLLVDGMSDGIERYFINNP